MTESPQKLLEAAVARAHAFLDLATDDATRLDERAPFTFGDLRILLMATKAVNLGHEIPHTRSNVR
ncbi:hypothetical protein [Sphingomonas hankookensis]|uniref:MarR family transcriptional regulator n=1 Tax=Sphingomonas hankookensis TaxID=563996 RepID=A0ABR5YDD0_9SPHN|nr:hypothetical protein [Sphingomonas hankookensis]KZE14065.1 hypothetical protein AVT10_15040 [Sphingomonas hankookensis]PZT95539.1 MAG: hypothetical protein DI625_02040 [Sphingomonas sp.]